jgi:hypothetical protein
MMQFNIHSLLYACIYKLLIFIILLFINHFHKNGVHIILKSISYEL